MVNISKLLVKLSKTQCMGTKYRISLPEDTVFPAGLEVVRNERTKIWSGRYYTYAFEIGEKNLKEWAKKYVRIN